MSEEIGPEDKYFRWGYYHDGRFCDEVIDKAVEMFSVPTINTRWRYNTRDHFLKWNEYMGPILWAKCNSNHLLFINGFHVIRIWTETQKSCIVDISNSLRDGSDEEIPTSCERKCGPLKHRIRLKTVQQAEQLFNRIKQVYGV